MREQRLPVGLRCRGIDGEVLSLQSDPPSTAPFGRCTGIAPGIDLLVFAYNTYLRTMDLPGEFWVPSGPDSPLFQIEAIAPAPSGATKAEMQET